MKDGKQEQGKVYTHLFVVCFILHTHVLVFLPSHFLTFSLSHFLTFSLSHFLTFFLLHVCEDTNNALIQQ
jgi:hypothetical protein